MGLILPGGGGSKSLSGSGHERECDLGCSLELVCSTSGDDSFLVLLGLR